MSGKVFFIICLIIAIGVIIFVYLGNINFEESDIIFSVKESTENFTNETIDKAKEKIGFKILNFNNINNYGLKFKSLF